MWSLWVGRAISISVKIIAAENLIALDNQIAVNVGNIKTNTKNILANTSAINKIGKIEVDEGLEITNNGDIKNK